MSPSSVSPDDMNRLFDLFDAQDDLLDGTTAERLLRADLAVDDAPPAYRDVTQALRLLTVAPEVVDHEREVRAVSAIARLIREGGVQAAPTWTAPRRERRLTQLVAVGAIGALSVFTGLASANALPDPAQHLAATVLEKIGINVPSRDDGTDVHRVVGDQATEHGASANGRDAGGTAADATSPDSGSAACTPVSGGTCRAEQHPQAGANDTAVDPSSRATPTTSRPRGPSGSNANSDSTNGATNAGANGNEHGSAGANATDGLAHKP